MEQSLSRRLEAMDRRLNGLLRKAALVAVTLAAMALALVLLPYCWPFVLAFVFSRMLEPFVRVTAKGRIRLGRKAAAALGVLLLFGVAGALATVLVTRLTRELVRALPQAAAWVGEAAVPWLRGLYDQVRAALPDLLPDVMDNALTSLAQSAVGWAASLSAALTSGAFSTAASIPHALLSTVLLVMGTYYMTADRARIAAFFHRTFPGGLMKRGKLVSARLWKAGAQPVNGIAGRDAVFDDRPGSLPRALWAADRAGYRRGGRAAGAGGRAVSDPLEHRRLCGGRRGHGRAGSLPVRGHGGDPPGAGAAHRGA